jgi:hypothetical protein
VKNSNLETTIRDVINTNQNFGTLKHILFKPLLDHNQHVGNTDLATMALDYSELLK